ncbi:MAG: cytochrome c biogenesis protein ResB [Nitrospiraceae bacterium]|nr:cytochrome c biogenesis protein ResB [Nitrospiraceae bacterium]
MEQKDKTQTIIDKIWSFFSSITFAVILFGLIAITSIIGTLIEQNASAEKNLETIGKLFGDSFAPQIYTMSEKLGFMDMYHSSWFIGLLMLFAANLIICSIDRLPAILKLVKDKVKPMSEERFKSAGSKKEIALKGKPDAVKDLVASAIKKSGFNVSESKESSGYQLYAEKGNYTRLGVYITHFSILFILLGSLIGTVFGFKGFVKIPEGRATSIAFSTNNQMSKTEEVEMDKILEKLQTTSDGNLEETAKALSISVEDLNAKMKQYGIKPLGFTLRCDNFQLDLYKDSAMPKKYSSELTIMEKGKDIFSKNIEVNVPLAYKGFTFYQASYETFSNPEAKLIYNIVTKDGHASGKKELRLNEKFTIPGTNIEGKLLSFNPALSFDEQGKAVATAQNLINPAVFIEFSEKGKVKYAGWLVKRYPETWTLPDGQVIEFIDYWGVEATGLQVRKDPGVVIVYFGCFLIGIGLYIAFFTSHRRLWAKLVEEKNNTRVFFAFTANKNREGFERKIDKIVNFLSKSAAGGK